MMLSFSNRELLLETVDMFSFYDVLNALVEVRKNSPYFQTLPYDSFAPLRKNARCNWFIDGEKYFENLYYDLESASESVFITDWWLSPELYLKRPVVFGGKNENSQLKEVLNRLAQKGVKVHKNI